MRRVHLRGRENIQKRLLIHVNGYNLSLVLRLLLGKGTPRGLRNLALAYFIVTLALIDGLKASLERAGHFLATFRAHQSSHRIINGDFTIQPSAPGC